MAKKKLMLLGGIRYLLPVIEIAHRLGCWVITVDYLPENIAHKYSDEYYNVSIIDKEAVLKVAKELHIDGILSYAVDPGVVTASYVAEQLGLPFTCSYEAACVLQDKALFRGFLKDNGFNVPHAKGYDDANEPLRDIDGFNFPVIVKPVDSAGSKGVTKVEHIKDLPAAISYAIKESHNGHFIIEDFLELDGYQSSADCFSINGQLIYVDYSDQLFDSQAANPYTPALEIWPSSMPQHCQDYLASELQRLLKLLGCGTGIYNVESRLCVNGKAYLMEVSPRAGGNRIAELQRIGSGVDLIEAEVCKAVGIELPVVSMPKYNGCYVNDIIHVIEPGYYQGIVYDESFRNHHVINEAFYPELGSYVDAFHGANNAIGSVFLKFDNRKECDRFLPLLSKKIRVCLA